MTRSERGYAMAALLVSLSVLAIMASVALPVWRTAAQREREAELIFRGEQYAHAIELYSRRNGGYPPSLEVLEKGRFIRKLYKDPVAGDANFQPVYIGQMVGGQPVAPRQAQATALSSAPGQTANPAAGARGGRALFQPAGQPLGQPLGQTGARGTIGDRHDVEIRLARLPARSPEAADPNRASVRRARPSPHRARRVAPA
jgi:type II secretory pathway pseudopilin PulG